MKFRHFFIDDLRSMWRRWSVWSAAATVVLLTAIPVIDDHWPDATGVIVSLFPTHGKQIAPVVGIVIAVAAQCIKQKAVLDALRGLFKKGGEDANRQ
ncbi:hypothetical protein FP568_13215 [Pandoraea pnomenusa]|uniref:hypothetical protein n=1 Tax=Pandoraea pnomenusa TaxID=93220 RepID=UPI0011988848|nr:hypothetical protein [Pandoraea pnomenusa]QDX22120.1 hypothetical protein FP568_13215 [Pandoraea pnomenusa]